MQYHSMFEAMEQVKEEEGQVRNMKHISGSDSRSITCQPGSSSCEYQKSCFLLRYLPFLLLLFFLLITNKTQICVPCPLPPLTGRVRVDFGQFDRTPRSHHRIPMMSIIRSTNLRVKADPFLGGFELVLGNWD